MSLKISYDRIEEFELAPGLLCIVRTEDNSLPEVIDKFLKRKTSIGELRQTMRVRGNPRCLDRVMSSRRVMANR